LAYYALNNSRQVNDSHRLLLGPPLLIALLFCFSFVLLQPHPSRQLNPSASKTTPLTTPPQANLPNLTLSTSQPLPLAPVTVAPSGETPPLVTSTPQQTAANQQAGATFTGPMKITIPKSTNSTHLKVKRTSESTTTSKKTR
jgi:hypothetical protein